MSVLSTAAPVDAPARLVNRYPVRAYDRDLRLDFLRGVAVAFLVVNHLGGFSLFHYLTWERVGFTGAAEWFVSLSGIVVGMVYGRRAREEDWRGLTDRLWRRAGTLYRANLGVIAAVMLLAAVTTLDVRSVTSFTDPVTGAVYPLFPAAEAPWWLKVAQGLRLQYGPHQVQIIALYVVLLFAAPAMLWLMQARRTGLLLWLSWTLYFAHWATPTRVTGAQFENAFPLLAWQLPFAHGLALGFHRARVETVLAGPFRRPILLVLLLGFLAFLFLAQNSPRLPAGMHLAWLPADRMNALYDAYLQKNTLGLLRVLNAACVLGVAYGALTALWRSVHRAVGGFFVPLGQASLYVFVVHVFVVLLWSNLGPGNVWVNTLGHAAALALLWGLVRYRVLFGIIPR